jgi:hypothetical protein
MRKTKNKKDYNLKSPPNLRNILFIQEQLLVLNLDS